MDNLLRAGDVRTGLLTDGRAESGLVAASLTWTENGPELSIPVAPGHPQFGAVDEWFHQGRHGTDLLFVDDRGPVTLSDVRYAGSQGSGVRVTKATARSAICQKARRLPTAHTEPDDDGDFSPVAALAVEEIYSTIDGLAGFSSFGQIEVQDADESHPERIVLVRDPEGSVTWTADGESFASALWFEVRRLTPYHQDDDGVTVRNEVVLHTTWLGGSVAPELLLRQQYPLRALLAVAYSRPVEWRTHHIRGQAFPTKVSRPQSETILWTPAFIADTARGTFEEDSGLKHPLFGLEHLGAAGMDAWFVRWLDDDDFRNPMQAAIESLTGFTRFLEPRVMLLINTLEALGGWVVDKPRTYFQLKDAIRNCVGASGADWSNVLRPPYDVDTHIAGFLATLQNDLKHGQRGHRRSIRDLRLADTLAATLVRMTALHGLPMEEEARKHAAASLVDEFEQELGQDEIVLIHRQISGGKPREEYELRRPGRELG